MFTRRNLRVLAAAGALVILVVSVFPAGSARLYQEGVQSEETSSSVTQPDPIGEYVAAPELSTQEQQALESRVLAVREKYDAQVDNHVGETTDGPLPAYIEQTTVARKSQAGSEYLQNPSSFFSRNSKITPASSASGSTLTEPSAANEGAYVFATGNTHAEYSLNRGATWTPVAIPGGPAEAPFRCCDLDVVYDRARGLTIWSVLYVNGANPPTNGVVRLFVNRTVNGAFSCSYTIDPGGAGNNTLPDYPHLGLSNDFLYLTMNLLGGAAGSRARVMRLNLDNMGDCVGATTNTFDYTWTFGQRVFVPVQGATDTMYWGTLVEPVTFRIYFWPDSAGVFSVDRGVASSNFVNPDCRGGANNADFIERSTAWSIAGFRMRGAVGQQGLMFLWHSANDANHPQAYVRAAVFSTSTLSLIAQPDIWNAGMCFGFPVVTTNDRGDFGLSIAAGGKAGGGGNAARGYVAIDDQFTPGVGYFQTVFLTAAGTHNRTDGRYGDYMSARRLSPCGLYFNATNYSLLNGTAVSNVNSRYVEFGRGRDYKCWTGWTPYHRVP